MSGSAFFRRHAANRLAQGDIALIEVVQLRSASGSEGRGPGPTELVSPQLPHLGAYEDFEFDAPSGSATERRIVRVWKILAMVISQNCEIEWADDQDSRLVVAPVVSRAQWPDAPWEYFARNPPPGYLYLPPLDDGEAAALGLPEPWPESVVVLGSLTTTTKRLVKPRRVISLAIEQLPRLQDSISRFFGVRGFATIAALDALRGSSVRDVVETGLTVAGPSRLVKVFTAPAGEDGGADDEVTVSYFGVRP